LFDRIVEGEALEIHGKMTKDTRMAEEEDYRVCFCFT
jgi:hypothetical protein